MIKVHKAAARGETQIDWLQSWHSFSFGDYYDPAQMGFRSLRVINEDIVAPGSGFPMHGHRDMEIVTYILSGGLSHRDSMGNGSTIRPGDVQRMSAGTGVRHSEYNASPTEPVHLLQIWLLPARRGMLPSYEEKHIAPADTANVLALVAAPPGAGGAVAIHQDARIYAAQWKAGTAAAQPVAAQRGAWIQVARGSVSVNETKLDAGDGAAIENVDTLALKADSDCEFLLFDLA